MALPKEWWRWSSAPSAETIGLPADAGRRKGHEILAKVPMEAEGPSRSPAPAGLEGGEAPEIASPALAWNLVRVPGLVGINNHEGSKFTADAASLTPVAEALAARHLFFFDSRTGAGFQSGRWRPYFRRGQRRAGYLPRRYTPTATAVTQQQLKALVAHARQTPRRHRHRPSSTI